MYPPPSSAGNSKTSGFWRPRLARNSAPDDGSVFRHGVKVTFRYGAICQFPGVRCWNSVRLQLKTQKWRQQNGVGDNETRCARSNPDRGRDRSRDDEYRANAQVPTRTHEIYRNCLATGDNSPHLKGSKGTKNLQGAVAARPPGLHPHQPHSRLRDSLSSLSLGGAFFQVLRHRLNSYHLSIPMDSPFVRARRSTDRS